MSETEPRWLTVEQVKVIHERQLARFGGPGGIRDEGALESALLRPVNRWQYGASELAELAAASAYGLARNHPFVDGNKRAAFTTMMLFLRRNGIRFSPDQGQATAMFLALAAGEVDENGLARWIRDNWPAA
jgi:death-on-curing protein